MTRAVLTVSPELPLADAAVVLDRHRIRRVPVVDKRRLVGILTRGDVIKTLANAPVQPALRLPDARLVHDMQERLAREPWATKHGIVVQATDGVISLWGLVASEAEKAAIESMARAIEGVKAIKSRLAVRTDLPLLVRARVTPA
jgi:CBS-domain-containing membrane protein